MAHVSFQGINLLSAVAHKSVTHVPGLRCIPCARFGPADSAGRSARATSAGSPVKSARSSYSVLRKRTPSPAMASDDGAKSRQMQAAAAISGMSRPKLSITNQPS